MAAPSTTCALLREPLSFLRSHICLRGEKVSLIRTLWLQEKETRLAAEAKVCSLYRLSWKTAVCFSLRTLEIRGTYQLDCNSSLILTTSKFISVHTAHSHPLSNRRFKSLGQQGTRVNMHQQVYSPHGQNRRRVITFPTIVIQRIYFQAEAVRDQSARLWNELVRSEQQVCFVFSRRMTSIVDNSQIHVLSIEMCTTLADFLFFCQGTHFLTLLESYVLFAVARRGYPGVWFPHCRRACQCA